MMALVSQLSAEGRIGDTKAECRERYHDAEIPARFDNLFMKGGVNTDCTFDRDGKCVLIVYRIAFVGPMKDPRFGKDPAFTEEQVGKLLALNAGGSEWERKAGEQFGNPWDGEYSTKDGSRLARVNMTGVTVELVAYREKRKALVTPEAVQGVIDGFTK